MASRSLKAAPRREVLEVLKIGDWGEVIYHHRLACGHTETRKRHSPASHIACSGCVVARDFAQNGPSLPSGSVDAQSFVEDDSDFLVDDFGSVEVEAQRIAAGLAARFQVPLEAVDVAISAQAGRPEIAYALLFLDASVARRLSSDLTGQQVAGSVDTTTAIGREHDAHS